MIKTGSDSKSGFVLARAALESQSLLFLAEVEMESHPNRAELQAAHRNWAHWCDHAHSGTVLQQEGCGVEGEALGLGAATQRQRATLCYVTNGYILPFERNSGKCTESRPIRATMRAEFAPLRQQDEKQKEDSFLCLLERRNASKRERYTKNE